MPNQEPKPSEGKWEIDDYKKWEVELAKGIDSFIDIKKHRGLLDFLKIFISQVERKAREEERERMKEIIEKYKQAYHFDKYRLSIYQDILQHLTKKQ